MTEQTEQRDEAFRLLGVSSEATPDEIRAAWRAMVRAYHPDQYRGDKAAAGRRLADLNAAFDLVSAPPPKAPPKAPQQAPRAATRACTTRRRDAEQRGKSQAKAPVGPATSARKSAASSRKSPPRQARVRNVAETGFEAALASLAPRSWPRIIRFV